MEARTERMVLMEDEDGLMVRTRKVADLVREAWTAWCCWDIVVDGLVFLDGEIDESLWVLL